MSEVARVRLGVTLQLNVPVLTDGDEVSLVGRNISAVIVEPKGAQRIMPFTIDGEHENKVKVVFEGAEQNTTGLHRLMIVENLGKESQTLFDIDAVNLVARSSMASALDSSLPMPVVQLSGGSLFVGGKGGEDGVGISTIQFDSRVEGANRYKITLTNGTMYYFVANDGAQGLQGHTPYIQDGYWFINNTSTGVKADFSAEEAARAAAETQRQAQEAQRQQTFVTNESARQAAYQNAEANRDGAYQEAESDRDDLFTAAETQRNTSVTAAQTAAQAAAASAADAADDAAEAAQKLATIQSAIDGLDPSQSTDDAVVALAARQGVLEGDIDALGPKIGDTLLFELNGQGTTYVSRNITNWLPNHTYRIWLTNWSFDPSTPASGYAFTIKKDGSVLYGVSYDHIASLQEYYDVTVVEGSTYNIGGRAASNSAIRLHIEDITLVNSIQYTFSKEQIVGTFSEGSFFTEYFHFVKGRRYLVTVVTGAVSNNTFRIHKNRDNVSYQVVSIGTPFVANDDYYYGYAPNISERPITFNIVESLVYQNWTQEVNSNLDSVKSGLETTNMTATNALSVATVCKEGIGVNVSNANVRNGSQGNPGNTWVVTFYGTDTLAIPIEPNHQYQVKLNKTPTEGFHFYYRLMFYKSSNPSGLSADISRNQVDNAVWHEIGDTFESNSGEYGLSIQLCEKTSSSATSAEGTAIALRATDFELGDLMLVDVTNLLPHRVQSLESTVEPMSSYPDLLEENGFSVVSNYSWEDYYNSDEWASGNIQPGGSLFSSINKTTPYLKTDGATITLPTVEFDYNGTTYNLSYRVVAMLDTHRTGSTMLVDRGYNRRVINTSGYKYVRITPFIYIGNSAATGDIVSEIYNEHPIDITIALSKSVVLGTTIPEVLERVEVLENSPVESIVKRNNDRMQMLYNACRYHKQSTTSKDYQVLICTDSHGYDLANINAVIATNGISTINAYVHCGDIVGSNFDEATNKSEFIAQVSELTKPAYIVCGNHDVGNAFYVGKCCNHEQAYYAYIEIMVTKGWLASGEYEVGKPYWYHDNATYKIRLIGLYEYDDNLDLDETYWEAIPYDSTLSAIAFNTQYVVGDKVNAGNYTDYSFECVQAVTTPSNYYTTPTKLPSYKVQRGSRVIRATQAQWFLDTLASTPEDYGVIVIMHNPFSLNAVSLDKKFSWPANVAGSTYSQNSMTTDFIRDAIVAFVNGTSYSPKVVMKGGASYLNTLNDGSISYAYQVSKDFSQKNSGVYLLGILGGHSHRDLIWKDATENIYQVSPNCAMVDSANDRNGDVRRTATDGLEADSLTVVSMAEGRIALVKLGVNTTENGTMRDFEVIDTTV